LSTFVSLGVIHLYKSTISFANVPKLSFIWIIWVGQFYLNALLLPLRKLIT